MWVAPSARYRLTVEDKDQRHSVVVSDPDVPEEVRSLIDWLHDRSEKD
jgi:Emfourin